MMQTNVSINNRRSKKVEYPFWFGGVASSLTYAIINHPYDNVKIKLATRQIATKPFLIYSVETRPSVVYLTVEHIITSEGVRGLYRGLSSGILGQLTYSTLRFGIYGKLKNSIRKNQENLPFNKKIICASLSGCMGGIFGMPPLIVISRMQQNEQLRNFGGLYHIIKNYGFKNFKSDIGSCTLMTSSQLAFYDQFKQALLSTKIFKDNTMTHLISGILASLVTTTIISPVYQVNNVIKLSSKSIGFLEVLKTLIREHKPLMLHNWVFDFLKLGPATAVTSVIFEQMKISYDNKQLY